MLFKVHGSHQKMHNIGVKTFILVLSISSLSCSTGNEQPEVLSLKLKKINSDAGYSDKGTIRILSGVSIKLALIGNNISNNTKVLFTTIKLSKGSNCQNPNTPGSQHHETHYFTGSFSVIGSDDGVGLVDLPSGSLQHISNKNVFYVCINNPGSDGDMFYHQGGSEELSISIYNSVMPIWIMIIIVTFLLCLSGLFSGLNLGLMALDQTELEIVKNTGTKEERDNAKSIMPIRAMGNFLLCSLLLGNVLVNNSLTILLDILTGGGGLWAVIGSTAGIVVFGEIIPQAICSRHGLSVGAKTIWITKFFMFVTCPLSFPISKLLDCLLGAEVGTVYNRVRLKELLFVTKEKTDLEKNEYDIVTGALALNQKTVKEVMTKLDGCFLLPMDATLNFETIQEIRERGYSRIPVYQGERANIIHLLFTKDLMFIDPDDNKPLEEVCKFYNNEVYYISEDAGLKKTFEDFKSENKGHLAIVYRNVDQDDSTKTKETIGLVTLEDIIEEIIQQEIVDEDDEITDNIGKTPTTRAKKKRKDYHSFFGDTEHHEVKVTMQMAQAVFQYLTTSVDLFSLEHLTPRCLKKILSEDVYRNYKLNSDKNEPLMQKGKPCNYFILIIEGRVQVQIGKEDHEFETGSFTFYGKQVLEQALASLPLDRTEENRIRKVSAGGWLPDYTLVPITDLLYARIDRNTYITAVKASRFQLSPAISIMEAEGESNLSGATIRAGNYTKDDEGVNGDEKDSEGDPLL